MNAADPSGTVRTTCEPPQHAVAPLHEGPSGPGGWSPGGWDRRGPGVPGWGERSGSATA